MIGKERQVRFEAASCIRQQFHSLLTEFPKIKAAIEIFNANKRTIPPTPLPAQMRDHKLDGRLKGIMECHLEADVLLLYEHEDDLVRMLYICRHEDLYGKRARQLGTRIQELRGEMKKKKPSSTPAVRRR